MRFRVLLLASALLLAGGVAAFVLLGGGGQREGELVFAEETIDAGRLPLGQKAPGRFIARNVGGKPVKFAVTGVKVLEGC